MLSYNDIEEIKQAGFIGFKTVAEMKSGGCRELPLVGGVYMIIRPIKKKPQFLQIGVVGTSKERIPMCRLRSSWRVGWMTHVSFILGRPQVSRKGSRNT